MVYFVIFNFFLFFFFSDFNNNFAITNICYEVMFRTTLAPAVVASSLKGWHAVCCEIAVAENYPELQKKHEHLFKNDSLL